MCSIIAFLLIVFAGFFGYSVAVPQTSVLPPAQSSAITVPSVEAPTLISCASPSADQDIADALAFAGDTFAAPTWSEQVSSGASKTTITWTASSLGAVAYLEWLHYDCGYTQAQIDEYYSAATWATIFANYDSYQKVDECSYENTHLYQYTASLAGNDYLIYYWVKLATDTRVAGLMLVVPADQQGMMAEYAGAMFPNLPTCQAAAG